MESSIGGFRSELHGSHDFQYMPAAEFYISKKVEERNNYCNRNFSPIPYIRAPSERKGHDQAEK